MKLVPADMRLRMIPLADALAHETDDPAGVRELGELLKRDGVLRNPIIVAELEKQYAVLDGATRVAALRELGLRDVLAQTVDYADASVQLNEWHHVIVGLAPNRLLAELADVEGVTLHPVEAGVARRELALRQILGCVVMNNGQHYAVLGEGPASITQQADLLRHLAEVYRSTAEVHQTVEVDLTALATDYPGFAAVVMFPRFTPAEVAALARSPSKLPMNITRHVIAGRALGLDIPLDMLGGDKSLEEKNAWLDALVHDRLRRNKVRTYQEPVIVFDE